MSNESLVSPFVYVSSDLDDRFSRSPTDDHCCACEWKPAMEALLGKWVHFNLLLRCNFHKSFTTFDIKVSTLVIIGERRLDLVRYWRVHHSFRRRHIQKQDWKWLITQKTVTVWIIIISKECTEITITRPSLLQILITVAHLIMEVQTSLKNWL